MTKKKVVVAYSGGLDTSYTVMYLAKEKGYDKVVATIYSFNEQSKRMFLAIGFEQTGEEDYELKL